MKNVKTFLMLLAMSFLAFSCNQQKPTNGLKENSTSVKKIEIATPDEAIAELKGGNSRFVEGKLINTNYPEQIEASKKKQTPHSVILSCMDSRVPPEIVFDQGIGNIFVARNAGNIEIGRAHV